MDYHDVDSPGFCQRMREHLQLSGRQAVRAPETQGDVRFLSLHDGVWFNFVLFR